MPKPKGKGTSQFKKKCVKPTSYPCGFTCIARRNPSGSERICHNPLKKQAATFTLWLAEQEKRLAKVNAHRTAKGRATYSLREDKLSLVKDKLSATAKTTEKVSDAAIASPSTKKEKWEIPLKDYLDQYPLAISGLTGEPLMSESAGAYFLSREKKGASITSVTKKQLEMWHKKNKESSLYDADIFIRQSNDPDSRFQFSRIDGTQIYQIYDKAKGKHEIAVELALYDGKRVPLSVLKDYPGKNNAPSPSPEVKPVPSSLQGSEKAIADLNRLHDSFRKEIEGYPTVKIDGEEYKLHPDVFFNPLSDPSAIISSTLSPEGIGKTIGVNGVYKKNENGQWDSYSKDQQANNDWVYAFQKAIKKAAEAEYPRIVKKAIAEMKDIPEDVFYRALNKGLLPEKMQKHFNATYELLKEKLKDKSFLEKWRSTDYGSNFTQYYAKNVLSKGLTNLSPETIIGNLSFRLNGTSETAIAVPAPSSKKKLSDVIKQEVVRPPSSLEKEVLAEKASGTKNKKESEKAIASPSPKQSQDKLNAPKKITPKEFEQLRVNDSVLFSRKRDGVIEYVKGRITKKNEGSIYVEYPREGGGVTERSEPRTNLFKSTNPLEILPEKSIKMMRDAISSTDINKLEEMLYPGNQNWRKMFEQSEGITLPKTIKGTSDAIADWARQRGVQKPSLDNEPKAVEEMPDQWPDYIPKAKELLPKGSRSKFGNVSVTIHGNYAYGSDKGKWIVYDAPSRQPIIAVGNRLTAQMTTHEMLRVMDGKSYHDLLRSSSLPEDDFYGIYSKKVNEITAATAKPNAKELKAIAKITDSIPRPIAAPSAPSTPTTPKTTNSPSHITDNSTPVIRGKKKVKTETQDQQIEIPDIAKFKNKTPIGEGYAGIVYRDGDRAIKYYKKQGPEQFLTEKEVSIAKKLGDIGVAPKIYNHNSNAMMMEFVDGDVLKEKLSGADFDDILRLFSKIHTENIAHQDVYPRNMIRGKDGSLKIIDCGLSTHGDISATLWEILELPAMESVQSGIKQSKLIKRYDTALNQMAKKYGLKSLNRKDTDSVIEFLEQRDELEDLSIEDIKDFYRYIVGDDVANFSEIASLSHFNMLNTKKPQSYRYWMSKRKSLMFRKKSAIEQKDFVLALKIQSLADKYLRFATESTNEGITTENVYGAMAY